jgi:hypothetical protein
MLRKIATEVPHLITEDMQQRSLPNVVPRLPNQALWLDLELGCYTLNVSLFRVRYAWPRVAPNGLGTPGTRKYPFPRRACKLSLFQTPRSGQHETCDRHPQSLSIPFLSDARNGATENPSLSDRHPAQRGLTVRRPPGLDREAHAQPQNGAVIQVGSDTRGHSNNYSVLFDSSGGP